MGFKSYAQRQLQLLPPSLEELIPAGLYRESDIEKVMQEHYFEQTFSDRGPNKMRLPRSFETASSM